MVPFNIAQELLKYSCKHKVQQWCSEDHAYLFQRQQQEFRPKWQWRRRAGQQWWFFSCFLIGSLCQRILSFWHQQMFKNAVDSPWLRVSLSSSRASTCELLFSVFPEKKYTLTCFGPPLSMTESSYSSLPWSPCQSPPWRRPTGVWPHWYRHFMKSVLQDQNYNGEIWLHTYSNFKLL